MKIQQSAEDYLETMLILEKKHGYIKSIDIAKHLGVTKPSVSYAVKRLKESGYIRMDSNGPITLTPPGRVIAERTYARHTALVEFLYLLGVEMELAEEDACKIEHVISNDTYLAICRYVDEHKNKKKY
ncbi:MAG: metal-dependent transcriptional regulator [Clostridiales bacterium]|nr:metal-dependent transcriptional regulator [Candidatus Crickella caballi]